MPKRMDLAASSNRVQATIGNRPTRATDNTKHKYKAFETHVIEPNSAQREQGEQEESPSGREPSLEQRKRKRHQAARQAVDADGQAHAPAAVPEGEDLVRVCNAKTPRWRFRFRSPRGACEKSAGGEGAKPVKQGYIGRAKN